MGALPNEAVSLADSQDDADKTPLARRGRYSRAAGMTAPTLTPQKLALLRYLGESRLLSLPQLARLCCPSEQSARRHLRELFDGGLVDIVAVSRAALSSAGSANDASLLHGSAPNVYVATKMGLETLVRLGHAEREVLRRPATVLGPKNALFLAHELAVRDVRVWLEADALIHSSRRVLRWRDGTEAHVPLAPGSARPDAWFVYQIGESSPGPEQTEPAPLVLVGLTEIDRGTERGNARWSEKLEDYYALFNRDALHKATGYRNARVIVSVPDARRRDSLADLLMTLVRDKGYPTRLGERFWLTEHAFFQQGTLDAPVWRRLGDTTLRPLLSTELLSRTSASRSAETQ